MRSLIISQNVKNRFYSIRETSKNRFPVKNYCMQMRILYNDFVFTWHRVHLLSIVIISLFRWSWFSLRYQPTFTQLPAWPSLLETYPRWIMIGISASCDLVLTSGARSSKEAYNIGMQPSKSAVGICHKIMHMKPRPNPLLSCKWDNSPLKS